MVLSKKKPELTREEILSKVSPFDVFRYYIGEFHVNSKMCSPLRKDRNPSFSIRVSKSNNWYYQDYATEEHGNCINLVMMMFGLTYHEALRKIAHDLGIADGDTSYKKIISQYQKPDILKQYCLIQCTACRWQPSGLKWWNEYLLDKEDLKKDDVYQLREIYRNRKKISIGKNELVFGYLYPNGWKIMFPERSKEEKWISNIPLDTVDGLDNLSPEHDTLIIPAKKCKMVMRKIYPYVCAVQNESLGSFNEEMVKRIVQNSKRVLYGGNSDEPGKKASYRITEKYQIGHINPPDHLLPSTKDWSDWSYLTKSLKPIEEHLKKKGVI